ncbi:MAG: UDP-3-O-(3-hydroxymyristoyl)glucosamine N-acyltransferase [Betaproteobacteria bacterium]|nr:UDP-3-O-(3-hydroxymyristoyl)glucosamine N-acyltransferase [Betaproteobacteria bacterium]
MRLGQIIDALGGELSGSPDLTIDRLAPLDTATPHSLSFVSQARYLGGVDSTQASAVIVRPDWQSRAESAGLACIITPDPYLYFARLTQWWRAQHQPPSNAPLIHPSAVVDPTARIHPTARIGPLCVVEAEASVGADSWLKSRVTLGEHCQVGERCIVHSGVVIGADGFGFAPHAEGWVKIEQLGAVRIGNDVEIGANSCVDRGALDDTVIEDGVKLDNLVQIGHNVVVGAHTAMAGCVGVAGSARIGARCTIGGGAVVLGHLTLADGVHISAASVVMRSILQPGQYSGVFPIDDNASWEKNAATLRQLHRLRDRIRALEHSTGPTP